MLFDEANKDTLNKVRYFFGYAERFLNKYLTFWIFQLFIFWAPIFFTKDPFLGFFVTKGYVILGLIISLFMFYSLNRLVTVYNDDMTLRFLNEEDCNTISKKIKFILKQKENRFELLAVIIFNLILPLKVTNPSLKWLFIGGEDWLFKAEEAGFGAKVALFFGVGAVAFLLYIVATLSAMKYWATKEKKKLEMISLLSPKEKRSAQKNDRKEFDRMFLALMLGYYLGSMLIIFFFPQLLMSISPLLVEVFNVKNVIFIIILALLPFGYRYYRAYRKRKRFIKELKAVCKRKRYILSKLNSPFRSIFKLCEGESFNVRIGERKYSCKIITTLNRGRPLYIAKGGIGAWLIRFKFLSIDLMSYTKSFDFGWKSDCKKVLIINPIPIKLLTPKGDSILPDEDTQYYVGHGGMRGLSPMMRKITSGQENSIELDNGDIIDGYEIYSATAFLNALERDVIDKD